LTLQTDPLRGVRVLDCSTLFAGPVVASLMGDFGADVIKIEHPRGDDVRKLGWKKDGESIWWAVLSRNKRCITLNLSTSDGCDLFKRLASNADVLVENFRPGTMERWGLGPDELLQINPRLVIVRTTGFGQTGPYRDLAGFGTLAEAMSGFAYLNGWPDTPPTLPPFALADGVAGVTGCFAAMVALWWRDHAPDGTGQVVDLSLYEPLFALLGPQVAVYDALGIVQERSGNSAPFTAPRNVYKTREGVWLALSASSQSIAERVMHIIGRTDFLAEPWFADHDGRLAHVQELDVAIQTWIGERTAEDVLAAFAKGDAAITPVLSVKDIVENDHYNYRETIIDVPHPRLGHLKMPNVIPRLSRTPGRVRHPGPTLGEHNVDIYSGELGLSENEVASLRRSGVI